jgi:hypothetical protein
MIGGRRSLGGRLPRYACELAQDRFWRGEQQRLIGSHRDWPDAAPFLELEDELAHAFVLVLSRFPAKRRGDSAKTFYSEREGCANSAPLQSDDSPLPLLRGSSLRTPHVRKAVVRRLKEQASPARSGDGSRRRAIETQLALTKELYLLSDVSLARGPVRIQSPCPVPLALRPGRRMSNSSAGLGQLFVGKRLRNTARKAGVKTVERSSRYVRTPARTSPNASVERGLMFDQGTLAAWGCSSNSSAASR